MSSTGERTSSVILREIIKEKIMEEESFSVNVFTAFTVIGIISALIFNGEHTQDLDYGLYGPAAVVVWSYLTALISIGCILLIKTVREPSYVFSATTSISALATIFLMIWIVSMNLKYFKKINMNAIPSHYFTYSWWTSALLLVQSVIVFLTMGGPFSDPEKKSLLSRISILNNIIIFLSFVLVMIQQIILDKFSVDVL
jgi:hypothetical protein